MLGHRAPDFVWGKMDSKGGHDRREKPPVDLQSPAEQQLFFLPFKSAEIHPLLSEEEKWVFMERVGDHLLAAMTSNPPLPMVRAFSSESSHPPSTGDLNAEF